MKILVQTIILALILPIGGCTSYYKVPTGSNLATLTIKNDTDRSIYPLTFKVNENCSGGSQLIMPNQSLLAGASTIINIIPDRAFSYFISYHTGVASGIDCFIVASFMPKSGQHYYSEYTYNPTTGKCSVNLTTGTLNEIERESSFVQREWLKPLLETSPRCK